MIALNALLSIARYDVDCGGDCEFVVLTERGQLSPLETYKVAQGEEYCNTFNDAVSELFLEVAAAGDSVREIQAATHKFRETINFSALMKRQAAMVRAFMAKIDLSGKVRKADIATARRTLKRISDRKEREKL